MRPCPNCGDAIPNDAKICAECDSEEQQLNSPAQAMPKKGTRRGGNTEAETELPVRQIAKWAMLVLLVGLPVFGFLLGGFPVGGLFAFLGLMLFIALLETLLK